MMRIASAAIHVPTRSIGVDVTGLQGVNQRLNR